MSRSTSTTRRRFLQTGAALVVSGFPPPLRYGEARQSAQRDGGSRTASAQAVRIDATELGGATLLQGAGGNVVALKGSNGALMIDGGRAANAEALLAAVKRATGADRVHTLVNTHWHPEQTGANEAVGRAGGAIVAHEKTALAESNTVYASVLFTGRLAPLPKQARPTRVVRLDGTIDFPGQQVTYGYMPAAHTDGDIYVHLPALNLIAIGGVASASSWPLLDWRNGAWLGGRVRALQRLAMLVKPDTKVVPADGRVMTGAEIVRHRDIYNELFETMIKYLNMGLGPEDAVAKNPLEPYEAEFGDAQAFTYGALKSMMIAYVPD